MEAEKHVPSTDNALNIDVDVHALLDDIQRLMREPRNENIRERASHAASELGFLLGYEADHVSNPALRSLHARVEAELLLRGDIPALRAAVYPNLRR